MDAPFASKGWIRNRRGCEILSLRGSKILSKLFPSVSGFAFYIFHPAANVLGSTCER